MIRRRRDRCSWRVYARHRACARPATVRVLLSSIFGSADLGPFCTRHGAIATAEEAKRHPADAYALAFLDCRTCDGYGVTEADGGGSRRCRSCADRAEALAPVPA